MLFTTVTHYDTFDCSTLHSAGNSDAMRTEFADLLKPIMHRITQADLYHIVMAVASDEPLQAIEMVRQCAKRQEN